MTTTTVKFDHAVSTTNTFETCKGYAKIKIGESYFNAKPGMVLQRDSGGKVIRIYNGCVYDDYCPDLPYWEEGKEGRIIRSFMWLNEAPDFVQVTVKTIEKMSENGHLYGVHNPNRNPIRKRKVFAMIKAAGLYSDGATHLIMEASANIKFKNLMFDGAVTFEEVEREEFIKIDGVPSICSTLNGDYTEYVTFRCFGKGKIILQSEYNDCELSPTRWRLLGRKEYDDKLKYYLSHPPISSDDECDE